MSAAERPLERRRVALQPHKPQSDRVAFLEAPADLSAMEGLRIKAAVDAWVAGLR